MTNPCDVLVIGGGPAGSTISNLLTEKGRKVVLLEMARHPRFHIGESLLPMNMPIFRRLGVMDEVMKIGVIKHAADFNTDRAGDPYIPLYFERAVDKTNPYAVQVRRSEFDKLLLDKSRATGTKVHEGVRVTAVDFPKDAPAVVTAVDESGAKRTWQARFVVDASGRDTFLSRTLGLKRMNPRHRSAAIFGHFRNVERRAGREAGNISLYWFDSGWIWMIPLHDGAMSIGAVCWTDYLKERRTSLEELLWATIRRCPAVVERMKDASLMGNVTATGNYSYSSTSMYGRGYLLIGDAHTFVDPVFSTGVYLAMHSAVTGAEAVHAYLDNPTAGLAALRRMEKCQRQGIRLVSWFIYRFTSPALRQLVLSRRKVRLAEAAVISVLAGDFYGTTRIRSGVLQFKALYYFVSLFFLPAHVTNALRRRGSVRSGFSGGTLPQDSPKISGAG
jgi:flavin-dependent dehydrogenase